jgi:hypothetical protein
MSTLSLNMSLVERESELTVFESIVWMDTRERRQGKKKATAGGRAALQTVL